MTRWSHLSLYFTIHLKTNSTTFYTRRPRALLLRPVKPNTRGNLACRLHAVCNSSNWFDACRVALLTHCLLFLKSSRYYFYMDWVLDFIPCLVSRRLHHLKLVLVSLGTYLGLAWSIKLLTTCSYWLWIAWRNVKQVTTSSSLHARRQPPPIRPYHRWFTLLCVPNDLLGKKSNNYRLMWKLDRIWRSTSIVCGIIQPSLICIIDSVAKGSLMSRQPRKKKPICLF